MMLAPLGPAALEVWFSIFTVAVMAAVGVASFRRCRCLSEYSLLHSVVVAGLCAIFWQLWLIVWYVNRDRLAGEWERYRGRHAVVATSVA